MALSLRFLLAALLLSLVSACGMSGDEAAPSDKVAASA